MLRAHTQRGFQNVDEKNGVKMKIVSFSTQVPSSSRTCVSDDMRSLRPSPKNGRSSEFNQVSAVF